MDSTEESTSTESSVEQEEATTPMDSTEESTSTESTVEDSPCHLTWRPANILLEHIESSVTKTTNTSNVDVLRKKRKDGRYFSPF